MKGPRLIWRGVLQRVCERQRSKLARSEGLLLLSVLGAVSGLAAGAIILLFRLLVESILVFLPQHSENFEGLSAYWRFALPASGGLALGLLLSWVGTTQRNVGIVHVLERLTFHHARLPAANFLVQFFTASLSLISGHSVGREGPCVHLGAAGASLFGQMINLPSNSLRVLVACGTAAAIAALFNTPLAGVVFAMEVVVMEYTITGFAPTILAAVAGAGLSYTVYGSAPAFDVPQMEMGSMREMPLILCVGVLAGGMSALFNTGYLFFFRFRRRIPIWLCCATAGVLVGVCALWTPQIMGVGYDTVDSALRGELAWDILLGVLAAKMLATTAGLGLGLPGGLIGPTLFLGACTGAAFMSVVSLIAPGWLSSGGFYAMLGMGAMMAATLQAPLAALTAMLELTQNTHVILPGMFATIVAYLVHREWFKQRSIYLSLIQYDGRILRIDPVSQSLQRIGVAACLDRNVVRLHGEISRKELSDLLKNIPNWFVLWKESPEFVVAGAEMARYLAEHPDVESLDPWGIAATRLELASINNQASMLEARDALHRTAAQALCVLNKNIPGVDRLDGILLPQDIENSYQVNY